MRYRGFVALLAFAALVGAPSTAPAWIARLATDGVSISGAVDVAVADAGDVLASGVLSGPDVVGDGRFAVVKLAAEDGSERWRYVTELPGLAAGVAGYVRTGMPGEVLAAGVLRAPPTVEIAIFVKLDERDGSERWRFAFDGPNDIDRVSAFQLAADGDAFSMVNSSSHGDGTTPARETNVVLRLDGATGNVRWRRDFTGRSGGLFIDAASDVYLAESTNFVADGVTLRKLSGADGSELWQSTLDGVWGEPMTAVDAAGRVVVVALSPDRGTGLRPVVMMLDGAAGAEVWRRQLPTRSSSFGIQVLPTAGGDVVVWTTGGLARLAGESGAVRWLRDLQGDPQGIRVALHGSEDVLVAGQRRSGFWVARLARRSGRPRWQRTLEARGAFGVSTGVVVRSVPSGLIVAGGSFKLRSAEPNSRTAFGVVLLCEADGRPARRCR